MVTIKALQKRIMEQDPDDPKYREKKDKLGVKVVELRETIEELKGFRLGKNLSTRALWAAAGRQGQYFLAVPSSGFKNPFLNLLMRGGSYHWTDVEYH